MKCDRDVMMMIDHHDRRSLHHYRSMMMMHDPIDPFEAINNRWCELFYQPHVYRSAYTSTFDSNKNHFAMAKKAAKKAAPKKAAKKAAPKKAAKKAAKKKK
ncbi:MAG: hypothetical protein JNL43_12415 [Flavobacteriales bacterium]|nr:hypothetical protein [Flavobacteriales bacterium]